MVDKDRVKGSAKQGRRQRQGMGPPRPKAKVRSIRLRARCKTPWVERKTRFATTNNPFGHRSGDGSRARPRSFRKVGLTPAPVKPEPLLGELAHPFLDH